MPKSVSLEMQPVRRTTPRSRLVKLVLSGHAIKILGQPAHFVEP